MLIKNVIHTEIKKDGATNNTAITQSYMVGSDSDVNFTISSLQELTFNYTKGTFDEFEFDVEAAGYTLADVSLLKAFVFNDSSLNMTLNDVRFDVSVEGVSLCTTSQFDMSNISLMTGNVKFTGIASNNALINGDRVIVYVLIGKK